MLLEQNLPRLQTNTNSKGLLRRGQTLVSKTDGSSTHDAFQFSFLPVKGVPDVFAEMIPSGLPSVLMLVVQSCGAVLELTEATDLTMEHGLSS